MIFFTGNKLCFLASSVIRRREEEKNLTIDSGEKVLASQKEGNVCSLMCVRRTLMFTAKETQMPKGFCLLFALPEQPGLIEVVTKVSVAMNYSNK